MERIVENLFLTPILSVIIDEQERKLIHQEMTAAMDKVEWSYLDRLDTAHELSTSTFTDNDIERYSLTNFKHVLDRELKIYCNELGFSVRKYSTTSWFSKFNPGNYGLAHNHSSADISGCYYFQSNGEDGNIFFASPCPSGDTSLCYRKYHEMWTHKPTEGKMLFFPGWLNHGIKRNTGTSTRISFAFNIYFER